MKFFLRYLDTQAAFSNKYPMRDPSLKVSISQYNFDLAGFGGDANMDGDLSVSSSQRDIRFYVN